MVIVMKPEAEQDDVQQVADRITGLGLHAQSVEQQDRTIINVVERNGVGRDGSAREESVERMRGVEQVKRDLPPFKLASREVKAEDTVVRINGVTIGGDRLAVMAGPCAVESRDQMRQVSRTVKEAGVHILRGGAFKPRTSPYSFQGLGLEGLQILAEMRAEFNLLVVTEVMAPEEVLLVAEHADILQIGARNMQNYALLHAVGRVQRPVLLKRGMMSTVEELLMAAEYILSHGNEQVMLCERGIRTFEKYTRNTLDINAVPLLKHLSHLPVIVDPSHGTGRRELVEPVSMAAVAAGADGLLVEMHPCPEAALSDGPQSLRPEDFAAMMHKLRRMAEVMGKRIDAAEGAHANA
ncbi:MAG TPA: 3-deoxy-7-phosphoheptulonate synthase [Chloroflexi bacterium]|nr:3-deoxy-7-phosphoheptulonate synthase [Chloroflexota bacterium]